jgi:hypothetical protein
MMISIEVKWPRSAGLPDELEIHLDQEGLRSFLAQLELLKGGSTDHIHMMSESWGGAHLAEQPQSTDTVPIHHVKILMG